MKNIIIATFLMLFTNVLYSNEVKLNFDFNVAGEEFIINKKYTNNDNINYKITRLEFYMCGFKLDDLELDDYLLVNGNFKTYSLGEYSIDKVNNVTMSFGVKKEDNINQDPNKYGVFHPLGPKDPSMHWGWAAGYRFWVVEGVVDHDNDGVYDKSFQYHVLGDEAFRTMSFDIDAFSQDGVLDINMDFDVQKLLLPVDMTKFVAYHDFYNNSQELRDFINNITSSGVITSKTTSSVESIENNIEVYPNPAADYLIIGEKYLNSNFSIVAIDGTILLSGTINSNHINLEILVSGTYLIRISELNGNIKTAKFVKN